jgi:magnesium-transporting ATPase (P-type)
MILKIDDVVLTARWSIKNKNDMLLKCIYNNFIYLLSLIIVYFILPFLIFKFEFEFKLLVFIK